MEVKFSLSPNFSHFELMFLFRESDAYYETNVTEMRLKSQNYQLW